jgi:hypothetical protein
MPARRDPGTQPGTRLALIRRDGRALKRIRINGCWYVTRDLDAGIRAYMGPRGARRFWHGYYNQKAIDHFTGGVVFPGIYSASRQEYDLFDDVLDNAKRMTGRKPETANADKGQSVRKNFERLTREGIAAVFPWRPGGGDNKRHDSDRYDRHGVPRCKHCGGPSLFVRFNHQPTPSIWFRCMLGHTPACANDQRIACSNEWRLLVPLWRTDTLYHELRLSHGQYESVHDWWRDRYRVGADGNANRMKMVGLAAHRLRANAACLIEWLRICYREGWLGSARRNRRSAVRPFAERAEAITTKFTFMRLRMRLLGPYGEAAERIEVGDRIPPSRRPRGAPTNQLSLGV